MNLISNISTFSAVISFHYSHVFLTFSLSPSPSLFALLRHCLFNKCTWPFHLSADYVCGGLLSRSCTATCIGLLAHYWANKLPLWKHPNIKYDSRCNKIRFRGSPDTQTWGTEPVCGPRGLHPPQIIKAVKWRSAAVATDWSFSYTNISLRQSYSGGKK